MTTTQCSEQKDRTQRRGRALHQGQSLIIVAFAVVALVALVGLAIDVGLVYVERIRARRAVDAAALAAAAELSLEAAAEARALEYLEENDYPCGLEVTYSEGAGFSFSCDDPATRIEINAGFGSDHFESGPAANDAERVIRINTVPYRGDPLIPDSADRIEVVLRTQVPVYFMRVFGFNTVPVSARAVGENIDNLDVVLVFDKSGSMEFDTLCYGCWTPENGKTYPDGALWPLPWGGAPDGPPKHCSGDGGSYFTYDRDEYIIIEAEEYSYTTPSYDRDLYTQGLTYWVIQRNGGTGVPRSQLPRYLVYDNYGAGALGRDSRGAYIHHTPYRNHDSQGGQGSNCTWSDLQNGQMCVRDDWTYSLGGPFPTPRVDYDFQVPDTGTWYIWARGQAGDGARNLMWGLNGDPKGESNAFNGHSSWTYNAADDSDWEWNRLGSHHLTEGTTYRLNIWAGASNFALDRLIITNDTSSSLPSSVRSSTSKIDNNRTGAACDPCDARFGGYPGGEGYSKPPNCVMPGFPVNHPGNYRYNDAIYDDEQPMRGAIEASKSFVAKLDARYDQVGLVSYESSASIDSELRCARWAAEGSYRVCNAQVITDTVIAELDALNAGGGTNMAAGMDRAIRVLSNRSDTYGEHYGRPSAAHIMILMTDGEANERSGTDSACYAQDYWPHNTGDSNVDRAKDCVVYYARMARNNGIVIYGITLGYSADIELMQYVSELTGGFHRDAPRVEQLDAIFDELYQRVFLRLVE